MNHQQEEKDYQKDIKEEEEEEEEEESQYDGEDSDEEDGDQEEQEQGNEEQESILLVIKASDNGKKDLYDNLKVHRNASKEEVQLSYDFLFKEYGMDSLTNRDLDEPNHQREKDLLISYFIISHDRFRVIYDDLLDKQQHQQQLENQQHQHLQENNQHIQKQPNSQYKKVSARDRIMGALRFYYGPSFFSVIKHPMTHISVLCQSRPYITDTLKMAKHYLGNFQARNLVEILSLSLFKDSVKHLAILPLSNSVFGTYSPFVSHILTYPLSLVSNLYLMNLGIPLKTIVSNLSFQDLFYGLPLKYTIRFAEAFIAQNLDYLEMFSQMVYVNNPSRYTEFFNKVMASPITKTIVIATLTCPLNVALIQYQSTLLGHICARAGILTPDSAFVLMSSVGLFSFMKNVYNNNNGIRIFYNGFVPFAFSKYFEIKKKNRENKKLN
ncbi:hypothetical protein CYY_006102 [Polysphondylium violaceum]|uniref:Transmembrane protein n=1 Tax=Polysphondylium violaceum TaxID=133409 RepID=A0A8J4PTB0_9MYCE|nr:hypothetical protein CYY_006102 [Polysphondylium violaceum]